MLVIPVIIQQCVPSNIQTYMSAIVKLESKNNRLAIKINNGHKLKFQAQTEQQAKHWVRYLEKHHYNFDIGLAQINIKSAHKYGYKGINLLDPCTNLKVGSNILLENYKNALSVSTSTNEAIGKAISAYNTGNFHSGFSNGYVNRVFANSNKTLLAINDTDDIPPIENTNSNIPKIIKESKPNNYKHTDTSSNPYSSRSLIFIQQRKANSNEISNM